MLPIWVPGILEESRSPKRRSASSSSKESSLGTKHHTFDISRSTHLNALASSVDPAFALPGDFNSAPALTFGKPSRLLLSPTPGPPSNDDELGLTPSPPQILRPPSLPLSSVTPKSKHTTRRFSTAEIEQDKRSTCIPSSHSPSPLKIPSKPASVASPPISETRGLRTAITALLGKRGTEARDETDGPAQKPQGRLSKRSRLPSRGKVSVYAIT
jgi:hypothetical protein